MTDAPPDLLTQAQLARAWGVSRQNINALKRKGIIRPLPSGLFDEAQARRDYYSRSDPCYRRAPKLRPTVFNPQGKSVNSVKAVDAARFTGSGAPTQPQLAKLDLSASDLAMLESPQQARARLLKTKADLAEMDLAEECEEVVSVAVVEQFWGLFCDRLRTRLQKVASEAAPLLADMNSIAACQQFMANLIDEAIIELAESPLPDQTGTFG